MDLLKHLGKRVDKNRVQELATWAGEDPSHAQMLWQGIREGDPPLPWMASWVLDHLCERKPEAFTPFVSEAVALLTREQHQGVTRTLAKLLSRAEIPEDLQGELYELCLDWVGNPQIPVAIRVHCMQCAYGIVQQYPELKPEFQLIIQTHMPEGSAGFKARGRKILKGLARLP